MVNQKVQSGFSLVELAIVIAILGLVFVGFSKGVGVFYHTSTLTESEEKLADIKDQLMNYAVVNKHLPCPDTNNNGRENRAGGLGSACSAEIGSLPYLDIGLKFEDVQDPWLNNIRYAVNQNADNGGLICDKRESASMFCNQGRTTRTPWFTLTDTPPFSTDEGNGNYTVCNQTTSNCDGSSGANEIETNTAVAVLVAFNKDGATTLANCGAQSTANQENCDTDEYYHQAIPSNVNANFFDDKILFISGYEVKAKVLGERLSWNSFTIDATLESTYEDYDITDGEDPTANNNEDDDVVLIRRNVETAIDLGDGDDYMAIGKDLILDSDEELNTGDGDDQLYIINNANGAIDTGSGNDEVVLGKNLTHDIDLGDGDDKLWVQGDMNSSGSETQATETTTETVTSDPVIDETIENLGRSSQIRYGSRAEAEAAAEGENWVYIETITDTSSDIDGNVETVTETVTEVYQDEYHHRNRRNRKNEKRISSTTTTTTTTTTVTTTTFSGGIEMGDGDDVLYLGNADEPYSGEINGPINGGDGLDDQGNPYYDILVLETIDSWNDPDFSQDEKNFISGFELIIFADDGNGNRNHCEWGDCGN